MIRSILPLTMFMAGLILLIGTLGPIVVSQLHSYLADTSDFIDPTTAASASSKDYTEVSNWFDIPNRPPVTPAIVKVNHYTISLPQIGLSNVSVEVYGTDLKKNAIQYPGTALPGELGNPVIFGHSTLAQLYKAQDPLSIFNPLPKAHEGDSILLSYDGLTYRYIIRDIREVKPTQIEVLNQRYDRRELTLITCVPLGTYLRRLVIRAELVQ